MSARLGFGVILAGLMLCACATGPSATPAAAVSITESQSTVLLDEPTALIRSASFVTRDLADSIDFYTGYLGYSVLGRSEVTAEKSRQVVGATGSASVRYVSLVPAGWTPESGSAGISFVEIIDADRSPFAPDAARPARAGELVLAHRATGLADMAARFASDGVPVVAPYSASGSGKSMSMAVLDPNGIRVELYEY